MSARRDEDELINALKKIPAESRRATVEEIIKSLIAGEESTQVIPEKSDVVELKPKRRVTELRGLGKEAWRGKDAQQYVDSERDSWQG